MILERMVLGALIVPSLLWLWVAVGVAGILVPLAWWSLRPAAPQRRERAVSLGLRLAGVTLLLLCLLNPQWSSLRPVPGANVLAMLADNSQGLQVADPGEPSRGQRVHARLNEEGGWQATLQEEYQVRRYTFDQQLRRVANFGTLDFTGARSDLGAALAQLQVRLRSQPLAGIVLITDGNATDLTEAEAVLDGLPPIYPVVVGAERDVSDLRIARTDLRQTAFDDAPVTLRIEAAALGGRRRSQVSLRPVGNGTPTEASEDKEQRQAITWSDDDRGRAEFQWRPDRTGLEFYEVAVTGPDPATEATLLNNRRLVMIDHGREQHRVLYVGGRMNWDFKFLNRALAEDPQIQLVGLLRLAHREPRFEFRGRTGESRNPFFRGFGGIDDGTTRYDEPVLTRLNTRDATELRGGFPRVAEELFAYDAVILDDLEASFFSPDQLQLLRRFVSERGGGLLMLGGADSLESGGYRDTTLAAALPVYLDRLAAAPPQGELRWQLTREGWLQPWTRIRAAEADERERLNAVPPLRVAHALAGVKPAATVLATLEDETGEAYPALVAQPFGSGRVATLGIGDLWRWGLRDSGTQADLARFWRQLARWLVTDVPPRVDLRVVTDPRAAEVQLRVTARTPDHRPLEAARVRLTLERIHSLEPNPTVASGTDDVEAAPTEPAFASVTLPAEPAAEMPGRYEAAFTPRQAGAYRVTAEVTDRQGQIVGRAVSGWVHDPAADEFARLTPNRVLLEQLAERTGGAVLSWEELSTLAGRLSSTPAPVMEQSVRPLWHNPWVFLSVLGCFLAEWGWRRWRGLP